MPSISDILKIVVLWNSDVALSYRVGLDWVGLGGYHRSTQCDVSLMTH